MSVGERSLAAIMFTDIVGYTRLSQANEPLTLDLLEEHRRLLRPLFPAHGGTEVKTMGDAFLVEFRSTLEAVLCAVEIQARLRERNLAAPPHRRLELRIGIHVGDVLHVQGDVQGDAVNVASRIEPLAEAGGVCVSQQVYDSVRNKPDLKFEKMGEVELKNVEFPLGVYKVMMPWKEDQKDAGPAPRERLAVLPFVNMSPDPNDEYFADGLTEELISKLSEVGSLKVIARTSVMNYKRKEKKVSEIGRELSVGSVIEGSVRKSGNKIRVAVQLIDAKSEEHLWASNYDNQLDDIFAIQSDIASKVADSITSGVLRGQVSETVDTDAYVAYVRAVQLLHMEDEPSLRQAVTLFEKAITRDSKFARAYAGLSRAWARLALGFEDFETAVAKSDAEARKAVALGPDSAEAHAALSFVCSLEDRFEEELSEATAAIRINPSLAEGYVSLGLYHSSLGHLEEGYQAYRKAYELDPLSWINYFVDVTRLTGREAEARSVLERWKGLYPRSPGTYAAFAGFYLLGGDLAEAQRALDLGFEIEPKEITLLALQGVVYALTGRREDAERTLGAAQQDEIEVARLYSQALIYSALGDVDNAFKALMRQAETHSWHALLKSLPVFDSVRKDPRFPDFCRKVGLPP